MAYDAVATGGRRGRVPPVARTQLLGRRTAGVWTAAQARACGLSEGALSRRVAGGEFQRLHRGVYCDGGFQPSPLMRGWAAVLARGGHGKAWAAGRTLARMLELPLIDDDDPATRAYDRVHDDVALLAGHPGRSGTLLASRPGFVVGTDTVLVGGCPSLTLERALPGLAAVLTCEALVCLLDAALHDGQLTAEQLTAAVQRERGGRQARALRQAAALADGRAESPNETLARLLLQPVLPGLVPQVPLLDEHGRLVARFDLGDEVRRFAVEADGKRGHAGEVMRAKDGRRDKRAGRLGWATERVTWSDLRTQQAATLRRVVDAAEQHARGSAFGRARGS